MKIINFYKMGTYSTKIKTTVFVIQSDRIQYNKTVNIIKSEIIVQNHELLKDISDKEL